MGNLEELYSAVPPTKIRDREEKFWPSETTPFWLWVADRYFYGMLEKRGIVTAEIEQLENGYEKHLLKAGNVKIESTLTPQELLVLEEVNKKFASFGSKQIADYSHNERGYKETKQGDIISYAYAEDIEW
jgi:hypothetical protein